MEPLNTNTSMENYMWYNFTVMLGDIPEISEYAAMIIVNNNQSFQCHDTDKLTENETPILGLGEGVYNAIYKLVPIRFELTMDKESITRRNNHFILFEKFVISINSTRDNAIKVFHEIVQNAKKFELDSNHSTIPIYYFNVENMNWNYLDDVRKRSLDTFYYDEEKKADLINDLQSFLDKEAVYNKFGIPYKRTYLLEGPPGTGKTSCITSLASRFNFKIGIITCTSDLCDTALISAVKQLTKNSIMVIEDVDNIVNTVNKENVLTISCLLNILDGFIKKNKFIIFLTTNHMDKLQDALKRPGRIDFIMTFEYPTIAIIEKMYINYFPNQLDKFKYVRDVIDNRIISIALLQKFFIEHIDCPDIKTKLPILKKLIEYYKKAEYYRKTDNHMYL